jgi:hypothetical protein
MKQTRQELELELRQEELNELYGHATFLDHQISDLDKVHARAKEANKHNPLPIYLIIETDLAGLLKNAFEAKKYLTNRIIELEIRVGEIKNGMYVCEPDPQQEYEKAEMAAIVSDYSLTHG